jgi:hypothetical protein
MHACCVRGDRAVGAQGSDGREAPAASGEAAREAAAQDRAFAGPGSGETTVPYHAVFFLSVCVHACVCGVELMAVVAAAAAAVVVVVVVVVVVRVRRRGSLRRCASSSSHAERWAGCEPLINARRSGAPRHHRRPRQQRRRRRRRPLSHSGRMAAVPGIKPCRRCRRCSGCVPPCLAISSALRTPQSGCGHCRSARP